MKHNMPTTGMKFCTKVQIQAFNLDQKWPKTWHMPKKYRLDRPFVVPVQKPEAVT